MNNVNYECTVKTLNCIIAIFQVYRFNIIPGYPVLELMTKAIAEFDLQGKVSC